MRPDSRYRRSSRARSSPPSLQPAPPTKKRGDIPPAVTPTSAAIAGDSRHIPARRLETDTASTNPTATPTAVLAARLRTKSAISVVYEAWPLTTTPATASAKMAPVGSLNADSAITVCDTLGRTFIRENSGIRIAGSVGASTAPINNATSAGNPNTTDAATPVMAAVNTTPGSTNIARLVLTLRNTCSDSPSPP